MGTVAAEGYEKRHKIDCERFFAFEAAYPLTLCLKPLYGAFIGFIDIQLLAFSCVIEQQEEKLAIFPCNTRAGIARMSHSGTQRQEFQVILQH